MHLMDHTKSPNEDPSVEELQAQLEAADAADAPAIAERIAAILGESIDDDVPGAQETHS
jgi:hypothetical protein